MKAIVTVVGKDQVLLSVAHCLNGSCRPLAADEVFMFLN